MSILSRGRLLGVFSLVVGCTGLDPDAFGARAAPRDEPEVAGWSFDAGSPPDGAGRGGAGARPTTSSGGDSTPSGDGGTEDGGAAGEAEAGATAGGGRATGGSGASVGSGGLAGTLGAAGRAGGGAGGRAGDAGAGGRPSGTGGASGLGSAGASGGGPPAVRAFFFSEYVEGSSSYKALEIQAREDSTLTGCRLVTYFNGGASGSGIALEGALSKGHVTTLCSTALAALAGEACHRATNLTFNGDDALVLECDGKALDVIGQIGLDPGDAWGSAEASTLNRTLRRRCQASAGDANGSDAFEPAIEWTALETDVFDGLGVAECAAD
jgi:hypothetical protein